MKLITFSSNYVFVLLEIWNFSELSNSYAATNYSYSMKLYPVMNTLSLIRVLTLLQYVLSFWTGTNNMKFEQSIIS